MILPHKLYVNVPVVEPFAKKSPYTLFKENGEYFLKKNKEIISKIIFPKQPQFYNQKTSSGKLMSRIGIMQGTYLGIYPTKVCTFWKMKPRMNCRFCSEGLNIGKTEEKKKTVEDVLETVKAAREEEKITFVHFNTGFYKGKALDGLEPYIKAVKRETGLLVGVQTPPAPDLKRYDHLKKLGVDHVSFCFELFNPQRFREICPGKYKYLGQEKYFKTIEHCVKIFGKGKVAGEFIAGLEAPEDSIKAVEYLASIGAVSTVCIFRPCVGTDLEVLSPPQTEEMIPIFRRMFEVCLEYSIPVGIAPNLRVSLVLLPFEGIYFVENPWKRYFLKMLKLKAMKVLFRTYFKTKLCLKKQR
jgi:hypothetical protein